MWTANGLVAGKSLGINVCGCFGSLWVQAAALPRGCCHAEPWGTIVPEAFTGLCPVQDNVLHPLPAS